MLNLVRDLRYVLGSLLRDNPGVTTAAVEH